MDLPRQGLFRWSLLLAWLSTAVGTTSDAAAGDAVVQTKVRKEATQRSGLEESSSSISEARMKLEMIRKFRKTGFPHPDETVENFKVGAQYRGVVKRSFPDLGSGGIECKKLDDGTFSVRLHAKVTHPDDPAETIEFDARRIFRLVGNRIEVVREENDFNEVAAKHKKKILNTVSLAYLIKWNSPRNDSGPFSNQVYLIGDKRFQLTYAIEKARDYWDTGKWMVVRLDDGEGNRAKFYLKRPYRGVRPLDKFRVYTRDKVVISFYITG